MKPITLSSQERYFFTLVKDTLTINPFKDERVLLDNKIADCVFGTSNKQSIENAVVAVKDRIDALYAAGKGDFNLYCQNDRNIMEYAFTFAFFYHYRKQFDQFIQDQIEAGDKILPLPFAASAKDFLKQHGFKHDEIKKIIEESYQVRRAYYFINQIIGSSTVMKRLRADIWNNIFTHNLEIYRIYVKNRMDDFSTLILGETGTGKGAVASAIGRSGYIPFDMNSNCFTKSFIDIFISINLSQFPESLIESELFGHRKGAFTGAVNNYDGILAQCSQQGSILLDELGEISLPLQVKLLQVLQERTFYPVGSHQKERFFGRVLGATNRSIYELRHKHLFRDDFYYRLCSDIITVPPLRTRIKDDPNELYRLLQFITNKMIGKDSPQLLKLFKDEIHRNLGEHYQWPGNVRELEQCVRRILLKKEYREDDLLENANIKIELLTGIEQGTITANKLLGGYCKLLYERYGSFEKVAQLIQLDRRTVSKYIREC
ncbi:MAG: sigma-54-dependent Fis family transcriptional regulator [Desulfobacterales bacterium]|nr:sigma-54-dependent Fis family transcriptional regulator [Desulfobacterales bacterium]